MVSGSSQYRFGVLAKIVKHMRKRHQEGNLYPLTLEEILDETNQLDVGNKVRQVGTNQRRVVFCSFLCTYLLCVYLTYLYQILSHALYRFSIFFTYLPYTVGIFLKRLIFACRLVMPLLQRYEAFGEFMERTAVR